MHDWPWRANRIAAITWVTVASSLASGYTIAGALPPSSSDTGRIRSAAARIAIRPTSVEPVNEIFAIPGCSISAPPHSSP